MQPFAPELPEDPGESFLLSSFRGFYEEVIRLRESVLADPWGASARAADETARREVGVEAAHRVHARLRSLLEAQGREARKRGLEGGAGSYREAQYVMAALADEVFLHLDWEGREAWSANLLEGSLFGLYRAGEMLFRRVDHHLRTRAETARDVAAVYLMALSLGFQGRYRGVEGAAEALEEYRRKLFLFVFRRNPSLSEGERRLFPQAHAHTREDPAGLRLPRVAPWVGAVAAVLLLYLAVSHGLWRDVTLELSEISARITHLVEAEEPR